MAALELPIRGWEKDATAPPGLGWDVSRPYLTFDAATDEIAYFTFDLPADYSSAPVLRVVWSADSATSGNVIFACEVMAYTPETDSADYATDSYDTVNTAAADSHLGTTAGRLHTHDITLTNADSMAAEDRVTLKFRRDADNASDTLAGDVFVHGLIFEYTAA